jgi:hypothetical protein
MLLQDLPAKTFHHLLKSVTWTEVDVAFPIKNPLRRFVGRIRTAIDRLRARV